ncbi:hypothetical protein FXO38_19184 [Capsicum annuum]|nr:hypothetical protein FXO38_19184 [Capsicum annuum]
MVWDTHYGQGPSSGQTLSKAVEDSFFDIILVDAAWLVSLRHSKVIHIVQALDESKKCMAIVTEPLFSSSANALGNSNSVFTLFWLMPPDWSEPSFSSTANALGKLDSIDRVPKELKGMYEDTDHMIRDYPLWEIERKNVRAEKALKLKEKSYSKRKESFATMAAWGSSSEESDDDGVDKSTLMAIGDLDMGEKEIKSELFNAFASLKFDYIDLETCKNSTDTKNCTIKEQTEGILTGGTSNQEIDASITPSQADDNFVVVVEAQSYLMKLGLNPVESKEERQKRLQEEEKARKREGTSLVNSSPTSYAFRSFRVKRRGWEFIKILLSIADDQRQITTLQDCMTVHHQRDDQVFGQSAKRLQLGEAVS